MPTLSLSLRYNIVPPPDLRTLFNLKLLVPWRSVHPRTDHATFRPTLSVHPTNRLLWHSYTCMIRPGIFRPPPLRGGRFVTCDMMSTLLHMLCDIMSTLSWSKIWTVCHKMFGPICDVLPAVWRHVDVLSQDFSHPVECERFVAWFLDICDVLPPAHQTVDVLSRDFFNMFAMSSRHFSKM
jgi:hypothetical protein